MDINFEAIALMALGVILTQTRQQQEAGVDAIAAKLVEAVKNSETRIDDTVVKDGLVPNLRRLADKIGEGLAA
jgi:hypothetical protein